MTPREVLSRFVDEAQRVGVGAHFHLSESSQQRKNSLAQHGKTPPAYVCDLGLLDLPGATLVAHCNAATEEDLEILAGRGTFVAHTPKTYQKLGMEMPPLRAMLARGVHVAFGTDGPASNSDLNLMEVMRIVGLTQKGTLQDPEAMPRMQLLRLATQAPAAALGFPNSGLLAPGRPADLVLLDTRAPHWIPRHDLAAGVVYTAHPGDVAYVWCDGRLLYANGECQTLDIERILWEAERRAFRMVGKPMASMRTYQA
jgi:5-methylthioadenosine/S-adenosylhomocysteine deaminase